MPDTIPVTIEVEPAAAAVLADARTRAAMGRLVSRVLHSRPSPSELAQAIADAKAEARAAGLANHASTRTTQLCDRRCEEISLDEVERIRL